MMKDERCVNKKNLERNFFCTTHLFVESKKTNHFTFLLPLNIYLTFKNTLFLSILLNKLKKNNKSTHFFLFHFLLKKKKKKRDAFELTLKKC